MNDLKSFAAMAAVAAGMFTGLYGVGIMIVGIITIPLAFWTKSNLEFYFSTDVSWFVAWIVTIITTILAGFSFWGNVIASLTRLFL